MNVYIAADFARAGDVEAIAQLIEELDFVRVVSRWHRRPSAAEIAAADRIGGPSDVGIACTAARRNLADIDTCDVFVVLTTGTTARGGRHFETGYALARDKAIIVVGPVEHAFQHLAGRAVADKGDLPEVLRNRAEKHA
jgi:nucleoside 2-deoxyribosyltransferase